MTYKQMYDQAALDAAVAEERERKRKMLEDEKPKKNSNVKYAAMLAAAPQPEPCVWKETSVGSGWFTAACCEIQIKIPHAGIYCCYCGHPLKVVGHE